MRLLDAHCASNGRFTEILNIFTRILRPPRRPAPVNGLLGPLGVEEQQIIVQTIVRDGFYIFPNRLPADLCDQIELFARRTPAIIESNRELREPLIKYDPEHPVSHTYKILERDSVENGAIQRLMADEAFIAIAEAYLNSHPAIGGVDVWWSPKYGNEPGSDAAQLFHFDFDAPPAWLKLFVYVTDVGPQDGPHVFVKGSHRPGLAASREFRSRGYVRISDKEIAKAFGPDSAIDIVGPRGTVFVADTRGFHKGKLPAANHRLVAQIIYCSPLFNDHSVGHRLPSIVDPNLAAMLVKAPSVFERFH
jgi:hypothetical protein